MSLLSVLKDRKIKKIYKKINKLNLEEPSKKRDLARIRSDIDEEYIELSKILFKALNNEDYKTIEYILNLDNILLDKLVNEDEHDIILDCMYKSKNNVIIKLYTQYFNSVKPYFYNSPMLYSIALNKKNIGFIEFFIKTKDLRLTLSRQILMPTILLLFQTNKDELIRILLSDFITDFNNRDVKAYLIYFISHNNDDILKNLITYDELINKLLKQDAIELFALAFVNNNRNAFEIMAHNDFLLSALGEPYASEVKKFLQSKENKDNLTKLFINK